MTTKDLDALMRRFRDVWDRHASSLEERARREIIHFETHGELEYAFEGLLHELMELELIDAKAAADLADFAEENDLDEDDAIVPSVYERLRTLAAGPSDSDC